MSLLYLSHETVILKKVAFKHESLFQPQSGSILHLDIFPKYYANLWETELGLSNWTLYEVSVFCPTLPNGRCSKKEGSFIIPSTSSCLKLPRRVAHLVEFSAVNAAPDRKEMIGWILWRGMLRQQRWWWYNKLPYWAVLWWILAGTWAWKTECGPDKSDARHWRNLLQVMIRNTLCNTNIIMIENEYFSSQISVCGPWIVTS